MSREYYSLSRYTEETYKYVINDIFDKDTSITGYKYLRPNPSFSGYNRIANETYAFFLTHYFKAMDVFKQNEQLLKLDIEKNIINIIDIGANIGTVTFACIDQLIEGYKKLDITINIVFVEVDSDRVKILEKAIEKYRQVTKLDIKYSIIEEMYENSIEYISQSIVQADTIILISNLLNWIADIDIFRSKLFETMNSINKEYQCNIINIETRSNGANTGLENLYDRISEEREEIRNKYFSKRMPRFNNSKGSYFYDQKGVPGYNKSSEYYYGYIINDSDMFKTKSLDYIKKAYYKSMYTSRSYFLFDQLEIKYTNANLDNTIEYIRGKIENNSYVNNYEYQYRYKKNKDEYRSLYLDDYINDIMNTAILITKGVKIDSIQNDEISYGNRLNKDLDSPFTFSNYYEQYFIKYQEKAKKFIEEYDYYYKIDLRKFYNNIVQEKMKNDFYLNNTYGYKYYDRAVEYFVNKELDQCGEGRGLPQGPDISHLLANLYLYEFDKWYIEEFPNAKMIRYVDDIIIFSNGEDEATKIYNKCNKYLKGKLNLEIGETKTEKGQTKDYKWINNNQYIKEVSEISNVLLRTMYKLDETNYNKFKSDPEKFINNYHACLQSIGINISKEWLNIKINKEVSFLAKLKDKFTNKLKKLIPWVKKKEIYISKVRLGKIPIAITDDSIEKWANKFKSSNKEYIKELEKLKVKIDNNLKGLIIEGKNSDKLANDIKSSFKFTMNKAGIFKINNIESYIDDIYELFPYFNKAVLSNYSELYEYIYAKLINDNLDNNQYDYAIYIWLLGEYKNNKALKLLEEIYWDSYHNNEYFINTLATEALLKVRKPINEVIKIFIEDTSREDNYYLIRNKLLLVKCFCNIDIQNELFKRYKDMPDERIILFLEWICKANITSVLDIVEDLPQSIKEKYPDYPITNEYLSL
ncbi:RNA-directed DNA polymerase [uncultured Clostridium sp.]|uniref:RNA-directed DNA polymerase n=1 Tax=uncultured Clostridium sp. TaxID=59620 RepID=UPI00258CCF01|nr:RNA-directed DNA polymerase [uncultured Clostridium sp.]